MISYSEITSLLSKRKNSFKRKWAFMTNKPVKIHQEGQNSVIKKPREENFSFWVKTKNI